MMIPLGYNRENTCDEPHRTALGYLPIAQPYRPYHNDPTQIYHLAEEALPGSRS
jgi:hypothetical protein